MAKKIQHEGRGLKSKKKEQKVSKNQPMRSPATPDRNASAPHKRKNPAKAPAKKVVSPTKGGATLVKKKETLRPATPAKRTPPAAPHVKAHKQEKSRLDKQLPSTKKGAIKPEAHIKQRPGKQLPAKEKKITPAPLKAGTAIAPKAKHKGTASTPSRRDETPKRESKGLVATEKVLVKKKGAPLEVSPGEKSKSHPTPEASLKKQSIKAPVAKGFKDPEVLPEHELAAPQQPGKEKDKIRVKGKEKIKEKERVKEKTPVIKAGNKNCKAMASEELLDDDLDSDTDEGFEDDFAETEAFDPDSFEEQESQKYSRKKKYDDEDDEEGDEEFTKATPPSELKGLKEIRDKLFEEIEALSEDFSIEEIRQVIREIDLSNINESDECQERYCENIQTTMGYCRLHYIRNWKIIKRKRNILEEGKLQLYIEELVSKYPAKYIEALMKDLKGEREFYQILKDLNIESNYDDDAAEELDGDEEDIAVETRTFSARLNFEDEEGI